MHVLVAAHDFYPDPGSGGSGRYVYETARKLLDRGHRVSVVTRRRGDVPHRETVAGIDVRRYDVRIADQTARTIFPQLPGAYRTVSRHVRELSADDAPDVLSFQGPLTSLFVDRAVGDEVTRTCTFHSPWPMEYDIKARRDPSLSTPRRRLNVLVRRAVERRVLAGVDGAVVLSEFMGGELRRVYGDVGPSPTVIPGGVDAERFRPDAGTYDPMDVEGPTFLTVRRLSRRMGHDVLLRAFARVVEEYPDARLFIAGDGPLRAELEETAAEFSVADRTAFLGYVPDADLPAAYATADVFVLPTTELEGFGLATVEALASGTPAVGTAVGGTVDVLGGLDDAVDLPADPLVEEPAVDPLATAMAEWASLDDADRREVGRACREHALKTYSWNRVAADIERTYEEWRAAG